MRTPRLLSTKALQPAQRSRLLAAGFAVQSYNALAANPVPFEMPAAPFQAIFTSQHAVQAFLNHEHSSTAIPILESVYCVGELAAQRLRKKGLNVVAVADAATTLTTLLFQDNTALSPSQAAHKKTESFLAKDVPKKASAESQRPPFSFDLQSLPVYYFCGSKHLPIIPDAFKAANTALKSIEVYSATPVITAFNSPFEVLFFYSPNGVKSFCENNSIGSAFVVAIGPTTAAAVAQYTTNYTVAKRPSFAHMLSALRADYNKEKQ